VTCSAGLDSCGASGSIDVLFTSGRGAAVASSAGRSDGVRKPSFKGSPSPGKGARRLESVGDSSSFTVTDDSWASEGEDGDTLAGDSRTEGRRPSAPFSIGAGVCTLDRFRLGRGGGVSDLGAGELLRSGGATKRRFSNSPSPRLSLSFSPQPGTRSRPKDEATPQKPEDFCFLRGGMGGLPTFASAISLCRGGGGR
jgi:hypothetical protein